MRQNNWKKHRKADFRGRQSTKSEARRGEKSKNKVWDKIHKTLIAVRFAKWALSNGKEV